MRFAVVLSLLALGYLVVFRPLEARIAAAKEQLTREQTRAATCREIEHLEKALNAGNRRVMQCAQFNEWVEAVVDATRQANLLVQNMELRDTSSLGTYSVITLKIELQGSYFGFLHLVRWAEDSGRANRIDQLRLKREPGYLYGNLELRGLVRRK
jgi:type II secretory pathway component PulM